MNIVRNERAALGIPLREAEFGSVVTIPNGNEVFYLVTSPMDGTGRRCLVTLHGGTLKEFSYDTRVVPMRATLHIGGPL